MRQVSSFICIVCFYAEVLGKSSFLAIDSAIGGRGDGLETTDTGFAGLFGWILSAFSDSTSNWSRI